MRRALLCLAVFAALVLAGHAAAAPDVYIQHIRALAPTHGPEAGRVVVLATVRYRPTRGLLIAAPNPARTVDIGRLDLTVDGAELRDADHLVRVSARPLFYTHRVVLGPVLSAGAKRLGRLRVTAQADQVIHSSRTDFPVTQQKPTRFDLPVRRVPRLHALPLPVCERSPLMAPFSRETLLTVVCMGEGARIQLAGKPEHGVAKLLRSENQRAVIGYQADAGYVGPDRIPIRAGSGASTVQATVDVDVQPFRLAALGDSVTAGFGYYDDGSAWGFTSLFSCMPPTVPNNRCSSNSPNRAGSANPVGWSPDFGYANDVAWPAQFAHEHGIGAGQYRNWAVSGSAPADWAGGYLNATLGQIASSRPDLVVMTLGANPLLSTFLFGEGNACLPYSGAEFTACVQRFVDQVGLVPNLRSVLAQVLAAQDTRVVVSLYHLAIPSANLYTTNQLLLMFGVLNGTISSVVQGMAQYGSRLFLMTPPRFNLGLAPPNPYRCAGTFFTSFVDGPSHQATVTQTLFTTLYPRTFCSGAPWIISADSGIHPNVAGYTQFAAALGQVVSQNHLMPTVLENR